MRFKTCPTLAGIRVPMAGGNSGPCSSSATPNLDGRVALHSHHDTLAPIIQISLALSGPHGV